MAQDYHCRISADITPYEAFEGICNPSAWWGTNIEGRAKNLDDVFTARWGDTYGAFRITELIPEKRIVWHTIECHLHLLKDPLEWLDTKIVWEISKEGNSTVINMTHVGLVPGKECFADCEQGWNFFVADSLFKLLTRYEGLPTTGIHARISVGDRTYKGEIYSRNVPLPDYPDGSVLIDVKENNHEEVVSAYAVTRLNKDTFDPVQLRGDNYMIVENKPILDNIQPLKDLQEAVK